MRAVIQKVVEADVEVFNDHELVHINHINHGLVVLLGVARHDSKEDVHYMADKIAHMRIFHDQDQKMNLSIQDVDGEVMLISQFTLYGDMRQGRRPSFSEAATPELAKQRYHELIDCLLDKNIPVKTGYFQTHMNLSLNNDGPVTILLDSQKQF